MARSLHPLARFACLLSLLGAASLAYGAEAGKKHAGADSRMPFPHRIMPLDETGKAITSKDTAPKPYSPAATCGKCHDYGTINQGWHFNAAAGTANPGRPGEPWVLLDAMTRTQIPMSFRPWPGTFNPHDLNVSDWQFVQDYARHLPGAGVGQFPSTQPADPKALWNLSGKLENDCMICHSHDNGYSVMDRELQLKQKNLKYAPTKALNLGSIKGSVNQLVEEAEAEGTDITKSTASLKMAYDLTQFDGEQRITFNVTRRSANERCYYCHTTNQVGEAAPAKWQSQQDVHLTSGLSCVDCHRHGLDHAVVRGYEAEAMDRKDASVAAYSCRGCHYGSESAERPTVALGGHLGAPRPDHKGLPPIHLEKLACTACHSGPFPGQSPKDIQTAMAHALGIESFTRTPESAPRIQGPVFLRGVDGKIAPHKVIWPNFWGRLQDNKVTPLPVASVKTAAKGLLPAVKETAPEAWNPLTDEQIDKVLAALAAKDNTAEMVYVSGGMMYRRAADGKVTAAEHDAAKPYAWAMGHDVRPANQALGARGCGDCHSDDSPIYFAQVTPKGPVDPKKAAAKAMYELRGDDGLLARMFAWSFNFRMMLKVTAFACAAMLAGVLVLYGLRGLGWLSAKAHPAKAAVEEEQLAGTR